MTDKKKFISKLIASVLLCAMCAFPASMICFGAENNDGSSAGKESMYGDKFIMVSLGDSYSSGEGNEKFIDQDLLDDSEKVKSQNWLAHRSENSWGGKLTSKYIDSEMSAYRCDKNKTCSEDTRWYFYAASGAVTDDFNYKQEKTYNYGKKTKDKYEYSGTAWLDPQLSVFDKIEEGETDYVTFSIGGNDLGFVQLLETASAFVDSSFLNPNKIKDDIKSRIDRLENKIGEKLKNLYYDVSDKAGKQAHIIVAGYPELFDENKNHAYLQISKRESKLINEACRYFDNYLINLISECQKDGLDIYYASVLDGFKGHGVDADEAYLTSIKLGVNSEDIDQSARLSSYCCHPNDKGITVYAEAVQAVINEIEKTEIEAVLVIDTSGSMAGTPIDETRKAADNFCKTVFDNNGSASIGLVSYNYDAEMLCPFTLNLKNLNDSISGLSTGGNTNIDDGLNKAYGMLKNSTSEKRIIVLMSDGMPNEGRVGQELIDFASEIKSCGITIYSLGFFQSLGNEAGNAQLLMKALASDSRNYFDVDSAENLVFFFGDISEQINGQKYIYIQIACPVDVKVSYNGETLSSKESTLNTRTSFGTLTFETEEKEEEEDEENAGYERSSEDDSKEDKVKILRLKDGADYNISIEGYARGKMDYTVSYMNENGEYTDVRKFRNINITRDTSIKTNTDSSTKTVLKVDSDGDGITDIAYKAGMNERGKKVEYNYVYYIIAAVSVLIAIFVAVIILNAVIKSKHKNYHQKGEKHEVS